MPAASSGVGSSNPRQHDRVNKRSVIRSGPSLRRRLALLGHLLLGHLLLALDAIFLPPDSLGSFGKVLTATDFYDS